VLGLLRNPYSFENLVNCCEVCNVDDDKHNHYYYYYYMVVTKTMTTAVIT